MTFPKWMRMRYGKKVRWTCERCGKQFKQGWMVEFHHKCPTNCGGKDTFDNMECLCISCHYTAHVELAHSGEGHPNSPRIIEARLRRSRGGHTRKYLKEHPSGT